MLEVRKTKAAQDDLIGIWRYTHENWGERQANAYLDQIEDALMRVAERPEDGAKAFHIKDGYWRIRSGRHVIFYRLGENWLEVVRVLHLQMDFDRHFD